MKCVAVIPAAGRGLRFGSEVPKQYLPLRGRSLLEHAIERFLRQTEVANVVVAVGSEWRSHLQDVVERRGWHRVEIVEGGATRQQSVRNAISVASESGAELVAIHDAVRPFFRDATFRAVLAAARETGAAIPGLPLRATIHRVEDDAIVETLDRTALVAAQTPQCFRTALIRDLLDETIRDDVDFTDEAALVANRGHRVAVVEGDAVNVKVTTPEDLSACEANFDSWSLG